MNGPIAALLIALMAAGGAAAAGARPCYSVHGRLFAANGTPTFRIWPVGTNRLLGIHNDENPEALPPELRGPHAPSMGAGPDEGDTVVYGDFTVCPLTRDRPGHMRMVTVKAVAHPVWVRGDRAKPAS